MVLHARMRARVRAESQHIARLGDAVSRVLLADGAMRTAAAATLAMTVAQKLLRAAGLTVGTSPAPGLSSRHFPAMIGRRAWLVSAMPRGKERPPEQILSDAWRRSATCSAVRRNTSPL